MSTTDRTHDCAARRHEFDGFTLPGAEKHHPPDLELEPVHLDIDVAVDLEAESCRGTVTTTLQPRRDGPTSLRLHAVAFEDVEVRDADGHRISWHYDGREIAVEWLEPVPLGQVRRVAVDYRVDRPSAGLYFSRPTPAYPDAPWWAATDHETERARHWLPCVDLPNARPRLDFHLRAGERFTILANGEAVGESVNGDGTKTAHWRLDYPCPSYLTCFVIGDLVKADDGDFEGRPVAYFAPPPFTADDLLRSFGRTKEMLAWMTARLDAPFPFPKYYQVALPGFGGAMENISLVSWDDLFVMDETLAREWTRRVDEVNLHEMAHSYFGDAVVCRDYAHAWLKESWATYMEQVWFEDTAGRDEQLYQYYRDAQGYLAEADGRYKRPLVTREFSSSWDMYDAHLYPGGACRLHTLRAEIGDGPFWTAVRDYLRRYAGEVVETEDFRKVMEEHSGRSLTRFFDQWFYAAAYPAVKVSFRYDVRRKEGTFEIEQTQVDEKSGVPAFELRTDVGWVIDGNAHSAPVKISRARHTVIVPMEKEPEQVRFDPHARVLHKLDLNPGDRMLRAQLKSAPDVIGRILAARELAKTGTAANVGAVRDAYRDEPFWGVRAQCAAALADCGAEPAIAAIAELVAWEQDPMVLPALLQAAGRYRDARVHEAVMARLDAGLPYAATAAALEALGNQRTAAPIEVLTSAADREGWGGIAQSAAFRALASSRQPGARAFVQARVAYGTTSNRARPAAVTALGELGRLEERPQRAQVAEQLTDLLRDPVRRVRSSAVTALESLGVPETAMALQRFRAPLASQEQVRVDRAIAAVRRADEPKVAALEKQLEEARTALRKVTDRVEALEARVKPADGAAEGDRAPDDGRSRDKKARRKKKDRE